MKNRLKINSLTRKVLILVFITTICNTINAQTDLPNEPVDVPAAPIDGYIYMGLALGLVLGSFVIFRKTKKQPKVF